MANNENDYLIPLILDIGSDNFRLGWAGGDFPDIIAPSVYVNISDYLFTSDISGSDTISGLEEIFLDTDNQTHLVGFEALKYKKNSRVQ